MNCPECGGQMTADEGRFPECEDCLFTLYDAETLALQAEVKREQIVAKSIFGKIPKYAEWCDYKRAPKNFVQECD